MMDETKLMQKRFSRIWYFFYKKKKKRKKEFGVFMNGPIKELILFDGAVPEVTTSD